MEPLYRRFRIGFVVIRYYQCGFLSSAYWTGTSSSGATEAECEDRAEDDGGEVVQNCR